MGSEELGTITNIQWILPFGAFAILFIRPSRSGIVLPKEATSSGLRTERMATGLILSSERIDSAKGTNRHIRGIFNQNQRGIAELVN
jgi:hypothetical protein